MLNAEATGFTQGMPRPGYFYVTPDGKVKEKFVETAYRSLHGQQSDFEVVPKCG